MSLTDGLAAALPSSALGVHNGAARSNTISGQFWCIVGARESYVRAFDAQAWQGFTCSLVEEGSLSSIRAALSATSDGFLDRLDSPEVSLDAAREEILTDLLEHEVQHHGQLIRYFYANGLTFPASFARRYALNG